MVRYRSYIKYFFLASLFSIFAFTGSVTRAAEPSFLLTFIQIEISTDGTEFTTLIESEGGIEVDLFNSKVQAVGQSLAEEGSVISRPAPGTYRYLKIFIKKAFLSTDALEGEISSAFIDAGIPLDPLCLSWDGLPFGDCKTAFVMRPFRIPDEDTLIPLRLNFYFSPTDISTDAKGNIILLAPPTVTLQSSDSSLWHLPELATVHLQITNLDPNESHQVFAGLIDQDSWEHLGTLLEEDPFAAMGRPTFFTQVTLSSDGTWKATFLVPPGIYLVGAFEDLNENAGLTWHGPEADEPFGIVGVESILDFIDIATLPLVEFQAGQSYSLELSLPFTRDFIAGTLAELQEQEETTGSGNSGNGNNGNGNGGNGNNGNGNNGNGKKKNK